MEPNSRCSSNGDSNLFQSYLFPGVKLRHIQHFSGLSYLLSGQQTLNASVTVWRPLGELDLCDEPETGIHIGLMNRTLAVGAAPKVWSHEECKLSRPAAQLI